jgi:hypothetical protein
MLWIALMINLLKHLVFVKSQYLVYHLEFIALRNYIIDNKYLTSIQRNRGLKYPFLVKRLACMIISGVTRSDSIDILQPANLTPEMILEVRIYKFMIMKTR